MFTLFPYLSNKIAAFNNNFALFPYEARDSTHDHPAICRNEGLCVHVPAVDGFPMLYLPGKERKRIPQFFTRILGLLKTQTARI